VNVPALAVRIAAATVAALAFIGATQATPMPHPSQTVPPDVVATPTATPLAVTGQIIDFERGYIVFATGDALKLGPAYTIVDAATGQAPTFAVTTGLYASVLIDTSTGLVASVRVSHKPIAGGITADQVPRQFVAAASSPVPNPDVNPPPSLTKSVLSKDVLVTVRVTVPPNTPFGDDVYLATDTSGWNAEAIKLQRLDGRRFGLTFHLAFGTTFHYLFTRGSWPTVERDEAGLKRPPRTLEASGSDSLSIDATVYRWADLP
jgi:hypothetical protein